MPFLHRLHWTDILFLHLSVFWLLYIDKINILYEPDIFIYPFLLYLSALDIFEIELMS